MRNVFSYDNRHTKLAQVSQTLQHVYDQSVSAGDRKMLSDYVLTTESDTATADILNNVRQVVNTFESEVTRALTSIGTDLNLAGSGYKKAITLESAAAWANPNNFIASSVSEFPAANSSRRENGVITQVIGTDGMTDLGAGRLATMENYDDSDNRLVQGNSLHYNLVLSQLTAFVAMFFQPVRIPTDEIGLTTSVRLLVVQQDARHKTDGSLADFHRRNIIHTLWRDDITGLDQTRLVPVYSVDNAHNFTTNVGTTNSRVQTDRQIPTRPLKFGQEFNMIGLCSNEELIEAGLLDLSDTIDPAVALENVYIKIGDDVMKLPVRNTHRSNFLPQPEGDTKEQHLNFQPDEYPIGFRQLRVDGSALTQASLVEVVTRKLTIKVSIGITGKIHTGQGYTEVSASRLRLRDIVDANGVSIDAADPLFAALRALFVPTALDSFDIYGFFQNLNKRQRGRILDNLVYNQVWTVPLRGPITRVRPPNATAQTDAADLQDLATYANLTSSKEGTAKLVEFCQLLEQFCEVPSHNEDVLAPEHFGVSRFFVKPTFVKKRIDLRNLVQTRRSAEVEADISAAVLANVRAVTYQMFDKSRIQAAIDARIGGISGPPTVLIGTGIQMGCYLQESGEPRTLGPDLKFKVELSPDPVIGNNIFIAFGYPDQNDGTQNVMHFGSALISNEMVMILNMPRNGAFNKELTHQPRFRFVMNVPVMGVVQVVGLDHITETRIPINFNDVTDVVDDGTGSAPTQDPNNP